MRAAIVAGFFMLMAGCASAPPAQSAPKLLHFLVICKGGQVSEVRIDVSERGKFSIEIDNRYCARSEA